MDLIKFNFEYINGISGGTVYNGAYFIYIKLYLAI